MSVTVDTECLRYDLAIRGINSFNFAKKMGRSAATMSAALAGKPIAEDSAMAIAETLDVLPVIDALVRLIPPPARSVKRDDRSDPA